MSTLIKGFDISDVIQRSRVFDTNLNVLILISLQSDGVNLWYFKLRLFDLTRIHICKDVGIRKSDYVANTRFLSQKFMVKELTLCHKLWFSNPNIFGTQCRNPLIFQTYIFWSNKSHSLKFQRFTTLESKDIGIRKSEFVAKSQFL